jgi:hypothetical protein
MNRSGKFALGERVKIVPQHWLRGGEIGRLIRFEQRGQNNWLVKFETSYPGGGIDGDKLWFDSRELAAVTEQDLSPATDQHIDEEDNDTCAVDLHWTVPRTPGAREL